MEQSGFFFDTLVFKWDGILGLTSMMRVVSLHYSLIVIFVYIVVISMAEFSSVKHFT